MYIYTMESIQKKISHNFNVLWCLIPPPPKLVASILMLAYNGKITMLINYENNKNKHRSK